MELNAKQTPGDKFWTIVHFIYNVLYDSEHFALTNELAEVHTMVEKINLQQKDQQRTVTQLMQHWAEIKKRMNWMLDQYKTSGQNCDVLCTGGDHGDFYKISGPRKDGGGYGKAC